MSDVKISQLPYVGKTGYTGTDIVPFVSYINPTGTTSETKIDDLKDYILDNSFVQNVIKVGKGGDVDFTSLNDAVQSITGSSPTNRYTIQVGPGVYVEPPISLMGKEYVSIVGEDIFSVVITPDNPSNTVIRLGNTNYLSFLTISGATSGVGIGCDDLGGFALVHKVSMYDNDVQITVTSSVADTQFYGEYIDLNGYYSYGVYIIAQSGYQAFANLENHFNFPSGNPTIANFCQGQNAVLNFDSGSAIGIQAPGSVAFWIEDNADMTMSNSNIVGWDIAIKIANNGGPSTFDIDGISIRESVTYDLLVEHINTQGTIQGSLSHSLINNVSENVFWNFLDHTDGELDITRKLSVTFKDGTHTDLSTLLFETGTMGVLEGGVLTIVSGLTISISEGYGYLESIINNGTIKRYDWGNLQHVLPADSNQYIYINQNGILSNTGTRPNSVYNIVLGRVVTNSTDIIMIDASPLNANHTSNQFGNLFRNALGPIYATGSIVTENVTPYHLDVTSGDYYYSTNEYLPSGGTDITFTMYYSDGTTGWTTSATTEVVNGYDDGSGTISPLPTTAFTKHTLYVVGEGVNEQYFLVLGQNQYPTLIQTENAFLPTPPPYLSDSVSQIASIYVRQGSPSIIQIEDIRPVIGFKAGGVNASSLHGNLLGLSADDHTQYLLVDGGRAMEGDLNMGGNDIYSAGTVSSNIISATTYQNLPVDPNTFVTAFTYNNNVFTIKQNNGQPDLTTVINSVTGWTVNGDLTITGNTSAQSVSATTVNITQPNSVPGVNVNNSTEAFIQVTRNPNQWGLFGITAGEVYLYSVGSGDTMSFFTNQLRRMSITPGGNVGVGITNPQAKLHVSGSTKIDGGMTATTISASTYQNLPFDKDSSVVIWPVPSTNTLNVLGTNGFLGTSNPGAGSPTINGNNYYLTIPKCVYKCSATFGSVASVYSQVTNAFAPKLDYNIMASFKFGIDTYTANMRMFIGLGGGTSAPTNVEPDTLTNHIGICKPSGATNFYIMTNDGTGTATLVDLGVNFPANTSQTDVYFLRMWGNSSLVNYIVERFDSTNGTVLYSTSGIITTDIPINTTITLPRMYVSNNNTNTQPAFMVNKITMSYLY